MSHLWGNFYALFRQELELRTIKAVPAAVLHAMLVDLKLIVSEKEIPDSSQILPSDLLVLRKIDGWSTFIDTVAAVAGVKDILQLDWFEKFGGRVVFPITGLYSFY